MMTIIKAIWIPIITIVLVLIGSSIVVSAETEYEYVDNDGRIFGYQIESDDSVTITDYECLASGSHLIEKLVIPDKIDGKKVKRVDKIYGWDGLKEIVFSDYMTEVDMKSFRGAMDLKKVTLGKYTKRIKKFLPGYSCDHNPNYKIAVPSDAKYLKVVKGALYSKDETVLHASNHAKNFIVLDSVTTIKRLAAFGHNTKTIKLGGKIKKIENSALSSGDIEIIKVPKERVKRYKKLLQKSYGGDKEWRSMNNVKLVTY